MNPPDQYDIAHMIGNKIVAEVPLLRKLWMELDRPPVYFNLLSRFYRNDCVIYDYQENTLQIVAALRTIAPDGHGFCDDFREIIRQGTGRRFQLEDNQHWPQRAGPIVHAFLHALRLLESVVQCVDLTGLPNQFSFLGIGMLTSLFDPRTTLDIT